MVLHLSQGQVLTKILFFTKFHCVIAMCCFHKFFICYCRHNEINSSFNKKRHNIWNLISDPATSPIIYTHKMFPKSEDYSAPSSVIQATIPSVLNKSNVPSSLTSFLPLSLQGIVGRICWKYNLNQLKQFIDLGFP